MTFAHILMIDLISPARSVRLGIPFAIFTLILLPSMGWGAPKSRLQIEMAELDRKCGGSLGCAVLNLQTGKWVSHRGDERFPMCSTFKASAIAFVLQRVDQGKEHLDRTVLIRKQDLQAYSPITKLHVGKTMTVQELCFAAVTESDNTAANYLLASFGGPKGLTQFWRSIGDKVTRLDRNEPALNTVISGDPRDTTTPKAMVEDFNRYVFGHVLKPKSRDLFKTWLIANKTGDTRLRAGVPHGWIVGDKTGTGEHNTANDIGILWPPHQKPLIVAAYMPHGPSNKIARERVIADVARAILKAD